MPAPAILPPATTDKPRIAIVIGGLGISATNTNDALAKLPGAVTLAFSPYGADIERVVARARGDGHEVLLQVPMEPFEYPDNDPGPQTLLTTLLADQNLDRLYWLMSRFQGYVGVVNVMGNRFTASERALTPVLYEITKRGLIYLDDGASPRSLASQIAGANNLPFAKAEVVLDAMPTPINIDRALTRLEAHGARTRRRGRHCFGRRPPPSNASRNGRRRRRRAASCWCPSPRSRSNPKRAEHSASAIA